MCCGAATEGHTMASPNPLDAGGWQVRSVEVSGMTVSSIQRSFQEDPLVCPRCSGPLTIISLIGDGPVIEKILRHLKLWDRPERPPPSPAERSIQYDEEIVDLEEAGHWPDATA